MDKNKTNDEIFAEALARILHNQIKIKVHFGLAEDDSWYGDCEHDYDIIDKLKYIDFKEV